MKALKYELRVTEGILAHTHGFYQTITEYYIPELNVTFNYANNSMHCFSEEEDKSKRHEGDDATNVQEIDIPHSTARKLKRFIEAQIEAEAITKEFVEK
jgi:hypothetical protein